MLIKKLLETRIDLFKNVDIYSHDRPAMIMDKLKSRYMNICFSGCLITNIIKIIRLSETFMADNTYNGAGYVNVSFLVEGIELCKGEVVHCVVNVISNNIVSVSNEYIMGNIITSEPKLMSVLHQGESVPLTIESCNYTVGSSQINALLKLYNPSDRLQVPLYTISDGISETLSETETKNLQILIDSYEELLAWSKTQSSTPSYTVFNKILGVEGVASHDTSVKKLKIDDLVKYTGTDVVTAYRSYIDPEYIAVSGNFQPSGKVINVRCSKYVACYELLYLSFLNLLNFKSFLLHYDTKEKIKAHLRYWSIYDVLKKQ